MGENAPRLPTRPDLGTFEFVSDPGALRRVWPGLRERAGALALDLETYGDQPAEALNPYRGEIRLLTVMPSGAQPVVFDLKALGYRAADWAGLFAGRQVIGHNLHFDAAWLLEKLGVRLPNMFCTWSAAKLLSNGEARTSNALGPVLERFLGVAVPKALGVSDWGSLMLTEGQLDYAAGDVTHLHALKDKLTEALTVAGLMTTFELEMALLPVVVDMESAGMPVNRDKLAQVLAEAEATRNGHEADVKEHLGTETGRFSSSDPNLQNIVRGPLRGCFEPNEPGRILVVADYSQI
jgi:ribonuclease D